MISLTLRNAHATNCLRRSVYSSRHEYKYVYPISLHSILSRASSHSHSKDTRTSHSSKKPEVHLLNAPATFPEPLGLPTREPDQSLIRYLLATGKAYLTFYKAGGKKIWHNRKAVNEIYARLAPKYGASYSKIVSKIETSDITRGEFQLLKRTREDLMKLPLFGVVLLVCGEFTPLIVVFITSIVPFTCKLPKQIEGDRLKLEERRRISFRNLTEIPPKEKMGVSDLKRMQLLHISWSLGLSSSIWDWLGGQLPGLPTELLRWKVKSWTKYLELDDKLISRYGGVKNMDVEELKVACVERGLDLNGKNERLLREQLESWIGLTTKAKVQTESLLLTRPSVWPKSKKDGKSGKN